MFACSESELPHLYSMAALAKLGGTSPLKQPETIEIVLTGKYFQCLFLHLNIGIFWKICHALIAGFFFAKAIGMVFFKFVFHFWVCLLGRASPTGCSPY